MKIHRPGRLAHLHVCFVLLLTSVSCMRPDGLGSSTAPGSAAATGSGAASSAGAGPLAPSADSALRCQGGGTAAVNLQIDAGKGPQGAVQPLAVGKNLTAMNLYDQNRADFVPRADPTFVAYLAALHPGMLRFPAGHLSQKYQFTADGPEGSFNLTPALLDAYIVLCRQVGAQPFVAVNIESGTPQNAAALVAYLNVTKKYGVTWFQIGNEPDVQGLDVAHTPQLYAAAYLRFAAAMKAVDPTIKLVGGELLSGENILGEHQSVDWMTPILAGAGAQMDAVAWHYYPLYSSPPGESANPAGSSFPSVAHLLNETALDWPPAGLDFAATVMPALRQKLATYSPKAQIWIDEFAEDPGYTAGAGYSDQAVGAIWAADALARYGEQGTGAIFKFIFKAERQHLYTLLDEKNGLRPEYYTYWMFANLFGDQWIGSSSDRVAQVAIHAARNSADNSLRVMLVNKAEQAQTVRLQVANFSAKRAQSYLLQAPGYISTAMRLNGQLLTPTAAANGAQAIGAQDASACLGDVITLPPFSVTLLVLQN